jgi:hypothetical protein
MSEAAIQQDIRLALGQCPGIKTFRNNCGNVKTPDGRWVKFGVGNPGGADLIGWRTVVVTPEMVGQRLAVFTSIEVKTPTGRLRPEQQAWLGVVRGAGGVAGVARSVSDAEDLLSNLPTC